MASILTASSQRSTSGLQTQPVVRQGSSLIIPPLEKRLQAYAAFKKLSARGKSRQELVRTISKQFGVSEGTVYTWVKGKSPLGTRSGRISYRKELFYVIGALLGDGCIYHWKNSFQIWLLGERDFCVKYAAMVSKCTSHGAREPYLYTPYPYRGRNVWFVRFQNAELYFLIRSVRKDLRILKDLLRRRDHFANSLLFIEGFFDAEGCVKLIKEKVRRTPKVNLDLCNTNLALLELIGKELKATLRIEPHFTSQRCQGSNRQVGYHLRVYRKDAIRKFLLHVPTVKLKPEKVQYVKNWLEKK